MIVFSRQVRRRTNKKKLRTISEQPPYEAPAAGWLEILGFYSEVRK
ncbi:MAG: hypothetical protein AAF063_25465 [Cyanobacteria bacterium J06643_5]